MADTGGVRMTQQTSSQISILFERSTEESLNIDTSLPGCENIDAEASCAKFDALWVERIQALYPDAVIRESERGLRVFDNSAEGNPEDTALANEVFQSAIDEAQALFNDGALWVVENQ